MISTISSLKTTAFKRTKEDFLIVLQIHETQQSAKLENLQKLTL